MKLMEWLTKFILYIMITPLVIVMILIEKLDELSRKNNSKKDRR